MSEDVPPMPISTEAFDGDVNIPMPMDTDDIDPPPPPPPPANELNDEIINDNAQNENKNDDNDDNNDTKKEDNNMFNTTNIGPETWKRSVKDKIHKFENLNQQIYKAPNKSLETEFEHMIKKIDNNTDNDNTSINKNSYGGIKNRINLLNKSAKNKAKFKMKKHNYNNNDEQGKLLEMNSNGNNNDY
mmetsp:Transcript_50847/g.62289  ORF Transcript_50847/g.62289 Transcript_50847/m.62289 type:complete len:187 (+) Transcript_50847:97-657(+)